MNRREFLQRTSLAVAATGLAGAPVSAQAQTKPPNFVFILIDDLGWPDLGCYGHAFHETPNCDRLAAQGMRFTDAYAACPVCSPTRASIIAGQYPARVGITDFIPGHWRPYEKLRVPINRTQFLPHETVTFAEALQDAGYTCGVYGKWHLGGREHYPDTHGFHAMGVQRGNHFNFQLFPEVELPDDPYMSEVLTDEAEKFLERNQGESFCLCLHHYAVHIPLEARQRLIEKYENKPKPDAGVNHPVYAAMVEHVDDSVGRITDKLDALGLSDNTVVVFFSDNGGLRQRFDGDGPIVSTNAPLRDEKGSLYEGGIRVPLIVRWPGEVAAGSVCAAPVTSVDFYPTFLTLAGLAPPADYALDGESLAPLLRGGDRLERDAIYWHYPHYHHSTPAGAIREGDYKLIEFFEDNRVELYNLRDDIGEANDLADAEPDRARAMQQALAEWRESVNAAMPTPNPDHDPDRAHEWGRHPGRT
jgi:arylsulfatase A